MAKKPAKKKAPAKKNISKKKKGLTKADVVRKGKQLSNWGKWGKNDQLGVLNYIKPKDIVDAAKLIKKGKVFRLGLELDENGPQKGLFGGRYNPLHKMLATGTDAKLGRQDKVVGLRYADDTINLPTQAASQWDALAHVFAGDKMWNGYDAALVDSTGAHKNGIEKFATKWLAAVCCSMWHAIKRKPGWLMATALRSMTSTGLPKPKALKLGAVILLSSTLARWPIAWIVESGAVTAVVMRLAWPLRRLIGFMKKKLPAFAPIPGASKCGRIRQSMAPTSLGIG